MTKPKRPRPPIVKTDWVVEEAIGLNFINHEFRSKPSAFAYIAKVNSITDAAGLPRIKMTPLKRTWRKVQ